MCQHSYVSHYVNMHKSNMSYRKKSKLALIFLLCGSMSILTAFSTTGWLKLSNDGTKIHIGLWRVCSTKCIDLNGVVLGWWGFIQATACLGLAGSLLATFSTAVCHFVDHLNNHAGILRFTAVTCIFAWIVEGLGCVVFVLSWLRTSGDEDLRYLGLPIISTNRGDLSYSLFLTIFGAQFVVMAGITLFHMLDKIEQCSEKFTDIKDIE